MRYAKNEHGGFYICLKLHENFSPKIWLWVFCCTPEREKCHAEIIEIVSVIRAPVSFAKPSFPSYNIKGTNNLSLAEQFRTASESNLSKLGKQKGSDITLDDLYLLGGVKKNESSSADAVKHVKTYGGTTPGEISQSLVPSGFRIPVGSKHLISKSPMKAPPPPRPPRSPLSTKSRDSGQSYFEIDLNTAKSSNTKIKKPPTLPSSRMVSAETLHKTGSVSSGAASGGASSKPRKESEIESVAFQNSKNYSSVQNQNFKPFPNPKIALETSLDLIRSSEW